MKSSYKGSKAPSRSKTIERKFTLSSSISSIRWQSKKRENQKATPTSKKSIVLKKTINRSSFSNNRGLNKKERFNALNLKVQKAKKNLGSNFSAFKNKSMKLNKETSNNSNNLDPSLERSLEKINNQLEKVSKNDFMGSR